MKKILKWIIRHVKPYVKKPESCQIDVINDFDESIEKIKKDAEIGIKLRFRF